MEPQLYYFITGYMETVMETSVWSTRHSTKRPQHTLGITSQAIRFIDELFEFGKDRGGLGICCRAMREFTRFTKSAAAQDEVVAAVGFLPIWDDGVPLRYVAKLLDLC